MKLNRRISLFVLLASAGILNVAQAFSPLIPSKGATSFRHQRHTLSKHFMSEIPRETDDKKFELPPPPEDQLVMTGDVTALFVYSFLDHSLSEYYSDSLRSATDPQTVQELSKQLDFSTFQSPVWFDHMHATLPEQKLLIMMTFESVATYSPVLASAGMASISMTTCWLLSGYIMKAFLFRHTVECSASKALEVTVKTWLLAVAFMVSLALGSDYVWGNCDLLHTPSVGGLTKADTFFIFDSLTILLTWRFMVSWLLGYER
mmetsp:Transcript_18526/g.25684  ORF Transcript_18526/g.25684 Transcript_18526/m.25684 type:complete len:261 (-) Transcript_18526:311-1093(-)